MEPVPLKYGKLATKYLDIRIFYSADTWLLKEGAFQVFIPTLVPYKSKCTEHISTAIF